MRSQPTIKNPRQQKGLALLIFVIVVALAFISFYLSKLSTTEIKVQRELDTRIALNKAKQALIDYAINFPEQTPTDRGPGYMPCPDTDNFGDAEGGCNGPATIGRLPWVTLGIGDLRDGANERLWYAVSENFDYTNSPMVNKINTSTTGNITVRDRNNNILYDGTTMDAVIAVIIAPGEALTRDDAVVQDRSTVANQNLAINYLDTASGEDNASFQQGVLGGLVRDGFIEGEIVSGAGNIIVNDQFVVVTYGEIMEQIHRRVAGEITNILNDYFNACNTYPEAAVFDPNSGAFRSASFPTPPPALGADLREGLLPITQAWPVDWGGVCDLGPPQKDAPVLPTWLINENWYKLTYYAFAHDSVTADGQPCGTLPNPPCMTVNNTTPLVNNAQAVIVFAGRDVAGVGTTSSNESDYFEGENNSILDGTFDAAEIEDYVRVVTP